jgi:hypothetical protein
MSPCPQTVKKSIHLKRIFRKLKQSNNSMSPCPQTVKKSIHLKKIFRKLKPTNNSMSQGPQHAKKYRFILQKRTLMKLNQQLNLLINCAKTKPPFSY